MNKYILLAWITLMAMASGSYIQAEIAPLEKTAQPGQYLKKALKQYPTPDEVLVVLDLDDTSITSPEGQMLGRSEMFYHLLEKERRENPNQGRAKLAETIDPLLEAVYRRVPVIATDEQLPDTINNLKTRHIMVIGMTVRGSRIAPVTLEQLKRANIHFYDTGNIREVNLDDQRTIKMEHGVVMMGHNNRAGESLVALIKQGFLETPARVIMIDNRQRHLDDVAQALGRFDKEIIFSPVLCTCLQSTSPFNISAFEKEMITFLYQWRRDPDIKRLIRQDSFTRKIIGQCHKNTACKPLQKMLTD